MTTHAFVCRLTLGTFMTSQMVYFMFMFFMLAFFCSDDILKMISDSRFSNTLELAKLVAGVSLGLYYGHDFSIEDIDAIVRGFLYGIPVVFLVTLFKGE